MLGYFAVLCILLHATLGAPTAGQLANAQRWITRSSSVEAMYLAYQGAPQFGVQPAVNFTSIYHIVKFAGDFGPGDLALEYDLIATPLLASIIGFAPVIFPSIQFDPSTCSSLSANAIRCFYTIIISSGWIPTNPTNLSQGYYAFPNQQFRFSEDIVFDANSSLISRGITTQDPNADTMFTLTAAGIPPEAICGGFIYPACFLPWAAGDNQSRANATGFPDVATCIGFLTALNAAPPSRCPFAYRSNSSACRAIHAVSSFFRPDIHCSHVRPFDSMPCRDVCLPACSQCHQNAHCVATYPNFTSPAVYQCVCDNGYAGNGTYCTAVRWTASGNCPAAWASYDNSTGLCLCKDNYLPVSAGVATRDYCQCQAPSTVQWLGEQRLCLPQGRCVNDSYRYFCPQPFSVVKCLPVANAFNPLGSCSCNYGFQGGWEFPCVCPAPNKQYFSDVFAGKICLAPGQCTVDTSSCARGQTCQVPVGSNVGQCVTAKRSISDV